MSGRRGVDVRALALLTLACDLHAALDVEAFTLAR